MPDKDQVNQATIEEEQDSAPAVETQETASVMENRAVDDKSELKKAEFQPLTPGHKATVVGGIDLLMDVNLPVTVEIGRTSMLVKDILNLGEGSVIETEKPTSDLVDVIVGGKLFARGEVVVLNGRFGVRITELASSVEEAKA